MMTEASGSSTVSCSSREWFEDSSCLDRETGPVRIRLVGGKKCRAKKKQIVREVEQKRSKKIVQKVVEEMVEVRVVLKIELNNIVSSKTMLKACVGGDFMDRSENSKGRCNKIRRGRLGIGVNVQFVLVISSALCLVSFVG